METETSTVIEQPGSEVVRIEVFPERDGNFMDLIIYKREFVAVRIEVFPERDGNKKRCERYSHRFHQPSE